MDAICTSERIVLTPASLATFFAHQKGGRMQKIKIEVTKDGKTETVYEGNTQGLQIVLSAFQIREQLAKDGYCPGSIRAIADTIKLIADEYIG